MRALLRSAEELRKAQQEALSGEGADDLRDRLAEQRRAVRALAKLGREILAEEGRAVSDAIVERIARTLGAAALDEGTRFLLRAGRLSEELDPAGFELVSGLTPSRPKRRSAAAAPARAGKRERLAEARREVRAMQQEARARAREAVDAERAVERAEAAAGDARRTAQEARERSHAAERALAEAEAALRRAQRD